ncbi:MAG: sulfur carrier protein ThiS [Gammaproteobacteria bacterium]|nr:sulfur carrier protein ThiS [Gammaproteobacteria bacterium]
MQIRLNGEPLQLAGSCSLEALLSAQDQLKAGVAVALNQQVIPRSQWATTFLSDHDDVDLFRAIAGG